MSNIIIIIVSVIIFSLYLIDLKRNRLTIKIMIPIAMLAALAYILHTIQFIRYPQGGGISLFSMMPIMLLSILYGRTAGVTGGLVLGILELMNGGFIVHPLQIVLDYVFSNMALGLAGIFGSRTKTKVISGCLLSVFLCVFVSIISGVVFFAQYAPEGMNVWLYSFIYNSTSAGVEGIMTTAVVAILPLKRFLSIIKLK